MGHLEAPTTEQRRLVDLPCSALFQLPPEHCTAAAGTAMAGAAKRTLPPGDSAPLQSASASVAPSHPMVAQVPIGAGYLVSRLHEENRWLREAVAQAERRKAQLVSSRQRAEEAQRSSSAAAPPSTEAAGALQQRCASAAWRPLQAECGGGWNPATLQPSAQVAPHMILQAAPQAAPRQLAGEVQAPALSASEREAAVGDLLSARRALLRSSDSSGSPAGLCFKSSPPVAAPAAASVAAPPLWTTPGRPARGTSAEPESPSQCEARRRLLALGAEAERTLQDLATRRGELRSLFFPAAVAVVASPVLDSVGGVGIAVGSAYGSGVPGLLGG